MEKTTANEENPGFKYFESFMGLNESSFKIPYSLLNANFKQFEISVHKEASKLKQKLSLVNDLMSAGTLDDEEDALSELNDMIKEVNTFEKQLHHKISKEWNLLTRIKKRAKFYNEMNDTYEKNNFKGINEWYQKYTNLLIADYLIRNCTLEQQQQAQNETGDPELCNPGIIFLKQKHMEHLIDSDVLTKANEISISLTSQHDLKPLMEWIKSNKQRLVRRRSHLEFKANFQRYIELLLNFDIGGAIHCLQTSLFTYIGNHFDEVTSACGLLVYIERCIEQTTFQSKSIAPDISSDDIDHLTVKQNSKPGTHFTNDNDAYSYFFHCSPPSKEIDQIDSTEIVSPTNIQHLFNAKSLEKYTSLLDQSSWSNLSDLFLDEYYSMYNIPKNDPLLIYISLGISALKTKECLHDHPQIDPQYDVLNHYSSDDKLENPCPICSKYFAPLSEDLPYAHHTESKLFDNPVMLPSGNVFDSSRLKLLANTLREKGIVKLNKDEVIDPIEKTVFNESDFVTMYPT
ncbi:GID complex subunit containing RING finger motif [Maudiozyma exigua]|uniref:GID complex subunit containing RING finger motif n=1 Tax=Maudiozyma exigua TaxID=34358 RepID=A0A9P6VVQ6_MAUEX|nr:GID complex subunit containing RING finger motif [Kazachstania exigua]